MNSPMSEEKTCTACGGQAWDSEGNACSTCGGNGTVGR